MTAAGAAQEHNIRKEKSFAKRQLNVIYKAKLHKENDCAPIMFCVNILAFIKHIIIIVSGGHIAFTPF